MGSCHQRGKAPTLFAFALLLTSLACRVAPTAQARPAALQVLFIGNSLTEANALRLLGR